MEGREKVGRRDRMGRRERRAEGEGGEDGRGCRASSYYQHYLWPGSGAWYSSQVEEETVGKLLRNCPYHTQTEAMSGDLFSHLLIHP